MATKYYPSLIAKGFRAKNPNGIVGDTEAKRIQVPIGVASVSAACTQVTGEQAPGFGDHIRAVEGSGAIATKSAVQN
jgi:hypothetical protein